MDIERDGSMEYSPERCLDGLVYGSPCGMVIREEGAGGSVSLELIAQAYVLAGLH